MVRKNFVQSGILIGRLKTEICDKTHWELGEKFSLKEFHNLVRRTGAVALEVLEEVVNEYIQSKE